ncbi:MAG TPA: hypothetical protein VLC71_11860 [Thermomonas sp.]|nr:hypothetical protein [Thermomonas sp.]
MSLKLKGLCLAAMGAAATLLAPTSAQAGNVGYYGSCSAGSKTAAITAAGHTPVAVASLSAASLAGLSGLVIESCSAYSANPDVNAAVNAGMSLVINDWSPNAGTGAALPGAPAVVLSADYAGEVNLATGAPTNTGPGGTLTDASLDGGTSSNHGYTASPMAPGMIALLTKEDPSLTIAFAYTYGSGTVIYNAMPMDHYLPGGVWNNLNMCTPTNVCAGMAAYLTNAIAWSTSYVAPPSTTCASSGYTGTQLTWCRNICEMGYTGATLNTWIHRWINRYRTLPYCAVAPPPV